MTMPITSKQGFVLVVTDADGRRHYPVEGASGATQTSIEREDSPVLYYAYQIIWPSKDKATEEIDRTRRIAEGKALHTNVHDRPTLPISVTVEETKNSNTTAPAPFIPTHSTKKDR